MNQVWQIIQNTPWWVFLLFFYLLKIGIDATKPRVVSLKKLLILPTVFLFLSIRSLFEIKELSTSLISFYGLALLLGIGGSWILARNLKLKFDKERGLIEIPGTITTLLIILIIFSSKYIFGYLGATNPELAQKTSISFAKLFTSGLFTGLFIGRTTVYFTKQKLASHTSLEES